MGYDTVRKIFHEMTEAIWNALHEDYLGLPTKTEWLKISEDFWTKWNMPATLGAIDGKHVNIQVSIWAWKLDSRCTGSSDEVLTLLLKYPPSEQSVSMYD